MKAISTCFSISLIKNYIFYYQCYLINTKTKNIQKNIKNNYYKSGHIKNLD